MNLKEFAEKYGNKEVEEAKLKDLLGIKDSNYWKPRLKDSYWYVDSAGDIYKNIWNNTSKDSYRCSVGNCYKTIEEAIFARDKQIFMTKLERDFEESSEEIDWGSDQIKYNLCIVEDVISVDFHALIVLSVPVTTDREWLENYIKENEADIKKYYFGEGKQNE